MTDLHDLLELSSDRIESPDLVARALTGARRRRTTHRAVAVSAAVVALVAGVAAAGSLVSGNDDSGGPAEQPSPTVVTQSPFDPAADDLPAITDDMAPAIPDVPALPAVIELPAVSPWLEDDPIDSAVVAFYGEDGVALLSPGGEWRSVPIEGEYGGAELSADGTQLAVTTESGADIWNLPTGKRTRVERPAGFPVADDNYGWWLWIDDQTLLLDDPRTGEGGWEVDLASGVPAPTTGPVSPVYTVTRDGSVVEVPLDAGLLSIKADAEHLVGIRDHSVVVAGLPGLVPEVELPFVDPEGNYTDGKMPVVALLDNGTVLLQVPQFEEGFSWRLVAWDPASGRLAAVTRMEGTVPASYAVGLLG